ncbi:MAG: hypothetical protein KJ069_32170, partial [Anaerolineae bacterium]|nr:hypothetical protein [Anaerolineae bacterium]
KTAWRQICADLKRMLKLNGSVPRNDHVISKENVKSDVIPLDHVASLSRLYLFLYLAPMSWHIQKPLPPLYSNKQLENKQLN